MITLLRRYHASLMRRAERVADEEAGVNGLILDMQSAMMPCMLPLVPMIVLMIFVPLGEQERIGLALAAGGMSLAWVVYVSAIYLRAFWGWLDVKKREQGDV